MTTLVFVYGTLKRGLPNHYLMEDQKYGECIPRGTAVTVEKFPLVVASDYNIPFMLHAPGVGHNIVGELYEVDKSRLERLDELEAHPRLYERLSIKLTKTEDEKNADPFTAEAYFLVKYKSSMLELPTMQCYNGGPDGKMFISPDSRGGLNQQMVGAGTHRICGIELM